jgi:hypothetical protein
VSVLNDYLVAVEERLHELKKAEAIAEPVMGYMVPVELYSRLNTSQQDVPTLLAIVQKCCVRYRRKRHRKEKGQFGLLPLRSVCALSAVGPSRPRNDGEDRA